MPVIVVGADTRAGEAILARLVPVEREVRVFVSDPTTGHELRKRGYKVAIGDVSDSSHVEAAATRCFSAVLIEDAAGDDRERSFTTDTAAVLEGWAAAVANSGVTRVIWVAAHPHAVPTVPEVVSVDPAEPDLADRVYELDAAHSIP